MFSGQTAFNLARDPQMIQILSVKSVRKVQKNVNRLEGPLLRRSRFLGWRPIWVGQFLNSILIQNFVSASRSFF